MKDGKVAIGIVGLTGRGVRFAGQAVPKAANCYVSCVCDIVPERVEGAVAELGSDVRGYTDIDAFLQDPDLDAVFVTSSDRSHKFCGVKVLQAKKHLYLEKPMAVSIEDCDALIDAWRGSGVVFMVGLELRYCTLMQECRRLMDSGAIGKVIMGTVVDNVSAGGRYFYHDQHRTEAYLLSLMLQKGTHSLDLGCWLMDASPVRAYCSAGLDVFGGNEPNDKICPDCEKKDTCPYAVADDPRTESEKQWKPLPNKCVYARECDVADNAMVLVDMDNGSRMTYMECHFTPEYTREFTFVGTKGKMTAFFDNDQNFKITLWKRFEEKPEIIYPEKTAGNGHGGGDDGIIGEFFRRIAEGKPNMDGVIGARDSAAIAIAAHESSKTGLPVDIPVQHYPEGVKR